MIMELLNFNCILLVVYVSHFFSIVFLLGILHDVFVKLFDDFCKFVFILVLIGGYPLIHIL